MAREVDQLLTDYDDLTDDVSRARHDFFCANLRRWFGFLDATREISPLIQSLEEAANYESWKDEGLHGQSGIGHGRLSFPDGRIERLGVQIGPFRSLTEDEQAGWRFAHEYVSSETRLDDMISDLTEKVFDPFAMDLRRPIERSFAVTPSATAPASDRIVSINHNGPAYQDLMDALEKVEQALLAVNDYDEQEDKEQRIAEISAGRRLLNAPRATLAAISSTIGSALRYLAKKFMDTALGKAAGWAVEKLIVAIPAIWTYFSS